MERRLGRPLESKEQIHHKDGRRWNNCPFNLEITTRSDHMKHHRSSWTVHRGNEFTKEHLISALIETKKSLGRWPNKREMKSPHFNTYCQRFGSWTNAVSQAMVEDMLQDLRKQASAEEGTES